MKLRRLLSDFRVDELNQLPLASNGDFAVYKLSKRGWNTLDVLQYLANYLKIPRNRIRHAGLKDRHAETSQLITIRSGPHNDVEFEKFAIAYLGQSQRHVAAGDITANEFTLVLRSLSEEERACAAERLVVIQRQGLVNYFDDQRFGSYLPGHPFIAEHWIRCEYEQALWLMFAVHSPDDDRTERAQKAILRDCWNDWSRCKQELARSHRRSIVTFLNDRKGDFKGAWARVNADLRGLALSAFQSYLWNGIIDHELRSKFSLTEISQIALKTGPLAVPSSLGPADVESFPSLNLPLPSARLIKVSNLSEDIRAIIHRGLEKMGWSLEEMKIRYPRDRFFSRGFREAFLSPGQLSWEFADDDLAATRHKLTIRFSLPRGSYATMLVKQIMPVEDPTREQTPD